MLPRSQIDAGNFGLTGGRIDERAGRLNFGYDPPTLFLPAKFHAHIKLALTSFRRVVRGTDFLMVATILAFVRTLSR